MWFPRQIFVDNTPYSQYQKYSYSSHLNMKYLFNLENMLTLTKFHHYNIVYVLLLNTGKKLKPLCFIYIKIVRIIIINCNWWESKVFICTKSLSVLFKISFYYIQILQLNYFMCIFLSFLKLLFNVFYFSWLK